MALLGKLIDVSTYTFTHVVMAGTPSQATVQNSLPAAADAVWSQLNSIEGVASSNIQVLVQAIAANVNTIGFQQTGVTCPTVAGTLYSMVAHSIIK